MNASERIKPAYLTLDGVDPRIRLKIDLVEKNDVRERDLLARFVMLELHREVASVDHRNDGVQRKAPAQHFVEDERLDDGRRIREAARLDHHPIESEAR